MKGQMLVHMNLKYQVLLLLFSNGGFLFTNEISCQMQ